MSKNIVINGERAYPGQYVFIDSEEYGDFVGRIHCEHKSSYDVMTEHGKARFSKKDNASYAFCCSDVVGVVPSEYDTRKFFERLQRVFGNIDFSPMVESIENFKKSLMSLKITGEKK